MNLKQREMRDPRSNFSVVYSFIPVAMVPSVSLSRASAVCAEGSVRARLGRVGAPSPSSVRSVSSVSAGTSVMSCAPSPSESTRDPSAGASAASSGVDWLVVAAEGASRDCSSCCVVAAREGPPLRSTHHEYLHYVRLEKTA